MLLPALEKHNTLKAEYDTAQLELQSVKASMIDYGDLDKQLKETSEELKNIKNKFYEEMKGRAAEKGAGKETGAVQKNTANREQKQPWMETGYLKMKDIEAIPLDQRLNILDHYQSGEYDPITITGKLITEQKEDYVTVRLPRQSGKFIRIPAEDFYFPEGSRKAAGQIEPPSLKPGSRQKIWRRKLQKIQQKK